LLYPPPFASAPAPRPCLDSEGLVNQRLPETLTVDCFVAGNPLPGAYVTVTLAALRKNPFHLVRGPADQSGRIQVTRDDLIRQAREEVHTFPMDYGDPEGDWSGRLVIELMNRADIERALSAFELWQAAGLDFPADYSDGLRTFSQRLGRHAGEALQAQVEIDPPQGAEVVIPEKAA
jgi:hypothetical protein